MKNNYVYENLEKINIVPPLLGASVSHFLTLLEVIEDAPLLISGNSGVGKSLFINILQKKRNKLKIVNCSHFDSALAGSELFGHVKGAFTGAIDHKVGLLESVNNETLVLDEIGELPFDVQAKLLMFVEDGYYNKVGSTEHKRAKVKIVGVTSRKEALREDFLNRFYEFRISPLYERREDVLYYIAAMYPNIIKALTPLDVLELLANNWVGNIREINKMILTIKTREKFFELNFSKGRPRAIEEFYSDGNMLLPKPKQLLRFGHFKNSSVDEVVLEKMLNSFGVGLDPHNKNKVFENFKIEELYKKHKNVHGSKIDSEKDELQEKHGIIFIEDYWPFNRAMAGFWFFCNLFSQLPNKNKNCLAIKEAEMIGFRSDLKYSNFEEYNKIYRLDRATWNSHKKLPNGVFEFLTGIRLPHHMDLTNATRDRVCEIIAELLAIYPENKYLKSIAKKVVLPERKQVAATDIWAMTFQELEIYYYKEIIKVCNGNKKKAAEKAGIKSQTFYSRLRKLESEGFTFR